MSIQEFRSRFVSRTEKGVLFAALRRLSLMNDWKSLAVEEPGWSQWPYSGGPGDRECSGAARS